MAVKADSKMTGPRMLLKQFAVYARMDLLWFLRDTRYCLLYMATDVICAGASAAGMFLLAERFGGFGGMSRDEVLFLLSYAMLVDGVYSLLFASNNAGMISRVIGRGQLDHCMIQPVPLWMQLLAGGFSPFSGSSTLICGGALCAFSISRLRPGVDAWWIFSLIAGVAASCAVVTAAVYLMSSIAFFAPAAAEEIAGVARAPFDELKIYPLGGLPVFWQTVFCTLAPIGLAAWLPSLSLLRRMPGVFGPFPVLTVLAAAVFAGAASLIFRKGMIYYAQYGCPRYSGFGHR